jgi:hemerythrin
MPIQWTESLATGIDLLDNQHKEFFARADKILQANESNALDSEIDEIILFLEDYVRAHFKAEEKYMAEHAYVDFRAHADKHREFLASFTELKSRLHTEGRGKVQLLQLNRIVVDWLINHISSEDKRMARALSL